jgi:hypothetical protein
VELYAGYRYNKRLKAWFQVQVRTSAIFQQFWLVSIEYWGRAKVNFSFVYCSALYKRDHFAVMSKESLSGWVIKVPRFFEIYS